MLSLEIHAQGELMDKEDVAVASPGIYATGNYNSCHEIYYHSCWCMYYCRPEFSIP